MQLFHIIKETMRRCCRKGLLGIASAAVLLLCGHESGPVYHCAAATRINNSDDITAAVPSSSSPSSLPTFFFYLKPFESDRRASYQHPVVALGEGLCALWQKGRREQRPSSSGNAATGDENSHCWWPSNVDYWPTVTSPADPKYLFRRQLLRDIAASATAANSAGILVRISVAFVPSPASRARNALVAIVYGDPGLRHNPVPRNPAGM